MTADTEILPRVRRALGDTDDTDYDYLDSDIYNTIEDAVEESAEEVGHSYTAAATTAQVIFSATPTLTYYRLFALKAALMLESGEIGNRARSGEYGVRFRSGLTSIDTSGAGVRAEGFLKSIQGRYENLVTSILVGSAADQSVDLFDEDRLD